MKSFMREEFKLAMNILFEVCAKYINECETHVLTSISEWLCDCRYTNVCVCVCSSMPA